jgi:hypothetical protein
VQTYGRDINAEKMIDLVAEIINAIHVYIDALSNFLNNLDS